MEVLQIFFDFSIEYSRSEEEFGQTAPTKEIRSSHGHPDSEFPGELQGWSVYKAKQDPSLATTFFFQRADEFLTTPGNEASSDS